MTEKPTTGQYETYLQYQYHELSVAVSMGNYPVPLEPHLKCTHTYIIFQNQ